LALNRCATVTAMGRTIGSIVAAWAWVGFSEFRRNQLLLAQLWVDH